MLGLEGFIILIVIALVLVIANYVVNWGYKPNKDKDSTRTRE